MVDVDDAAAVWKRSNSILILNRLATERDSPAYADLIQVEDSV